MTEFHHLVIVIMDRQCVYLRLDLLKKNLVRDCYSNKINSINQLSLTKKHFSSCLEDSLSSTIRVKRGKRLEVSTCLHIACLFSRVEIVERLLDLGADPQQVDGVHESPLHKACVTKINCKEKIQLLLSKDPTLVLKKTRHGTYPVHMVSRRSDPRCLKTLLEIDPRHAGYVTKKKLTPLHVAANTGLVQNIEMLLLNPYVNVNAADIHGHTPAHHAAIGSHMDALLLIARQAHYDMHCQNYAKLIASECLSIEKALFFHATISSHDTFTQYLSTLDDVHDIVAFRYRDQTVLHSIASSDVDSSRKAEFVVERHPALLHTRNDSRQLPLHVAAMNQGRNLLEFIILVSCQNGGRRYC